MCKRSHIILVLFVATIICVATIRFYERETKKEGEFLLKNPMDGYMILKKIWH
jgi:hypothetical protein